jgi:hypothetical protein
MPPGYLARKLMVTSFNEAVSVHQNLPVPKIDDRLFCGQNLYIVFDHCSPISVIAIDEIKL